MENPVKDSARIDTDRVTKRILAHAAAFLSAHRDQEKAEKIGRTYGYFVSHPVASLNRKRLRALLEALQARSATLGRPLRVLDLACGGGLITCAIAELGHRALGIDLDADELRLARSFASERGLAGEFVQMNLLEDADWEKRAEAALGGKPDVVTLAYALHHFPRVEEFVTRISGWLEPGAIVLVNEENPQSPLFRLKHRVRTWIQHDTETEWHRSYSGWRALLESNRFRFTAERPVGLDPIPLLSRLAPLSCWSLVFAAERS